MLTKEPMGVQATWQSGKMISDLVPQLAELADEMCFHFIRDRQIPTRRPAKISCSTVTRLMVFLAWEAGPLGVGN